MNTECLFTVCSRAREHEHLGEQLVNSAAASVEQDRVVLHVAAAKACQDSCPVWTAPTAAKGASRRTPSTASCPSSPPPPLLVRTYGELGALNAESICERILRAAGLVLDDGNTMLADATLEKLTLQRSNVRYQSLHMRHGGLEHRLRWWPVLAARGRECT